MCQYSGLMCKRMNEFNNKFKNIAANNEFGVHIKEVRVDVLLPCKAVKGVAVQAC